LDNDEEVIKEIMEAFLVDNPARVEALDEAIKAKNAEEISSLAHAIKGSAATISANSLAEAAYQLEIAGKQGNLEHADALFANIQVKLEKLRSFLSQPDWIETAKQQENRQAEQLSKKAVK
jgi:HPt (histidine-containing phosphotransfer) domain-containing protein